MLPFAVYAPTDVQKPDMTEMFYDEQASKAHS